MFNVSSLALICGLVIQLGTASASAAYLFDATLSLTADCSTAPSLDPIPDPPIEACPSGAHPPSGPFLMPQGVAVDLWGNLYVSSFGGEEDGTKGRVDIFDSNGFFISELAIPYGPQNIAVDSEGNLYVREFPPGSGTRRLSRYAPTTYEPAAGNITYSSIPTLVLKAFEPINALPFVSGIAINPANDHLFVHYENRIAEFNSAKEGNGLLDSTIGEGLLKAGAWIGIDATRNRIYASDIQGSVTSSQIRVFELQAPHNQLKSMSGSDVPGGKFGSAQASLLPAVDEETGNFFIYDLGQNRALEFNAGYEYQATITHGFKSPEPPAIAVDNGDSSPNKGYLYVTSGFKETGHSYAFEPFDEPDPPVVESITFGEVAEDEVELKATIDPGGVSTTYTFEYTTHTDEDFSEALEGGEGTIPAGGEGVAVAGSAVDLEPGGEYRFRVVAKNEKGEDEDEATFATYPAVGPLIPCPANEASRTGSSVHLPDCRAYELVTPADTNGRIPKAPAGIRGEFPSFTSSPSGNAASFLITGGSLPGTEVTGAFNGENYLSTRGGAGWHTTSAGPTGAETMSGSPGSFSRDQGYTFWSTKLGDEGTATIGGRVTSYLRYPDGHSELVGRGSIDTDPEVESSFINEDGTHVVFATRNFGPHVPVQIEPNAPPSGTEAVYDRTRDPLTGEENTHVVSLLPGDLTPAAGQDALYLGASLDGKGIAFRIGSTLYLRFANEATFEIAPGVTYAGVTEGGGRIFYVEGGNLKAFDVATEKEIAFTTTGDVTPVNVGTEGTRAYFVSPSVLGGENPVGNVAQSGEQNLYLSEEGTISFVGTVTDRDVEGEKTTSSGFIGGLGLWTERIEVAWAAYDPSRTTPDGTAFLFESRGELTGFDSGGKAQIYRYDSAADRLHCVSCNPTTQVPDSDASLLSLTVLDLKAPLPAISLLPNLRPDGKRAFFQSSEPLVAADTDGRQDVYEWEEEGVGSCTRKGGCVYLISSGRSANDDYLYGISESGDDVFFITLDRLFPRDTEPTVSIYDARVGGGFPEPEERICIGEGCRLPSSPAPAVSSPAKPALGADDNVHPTRRCAKGKRKVKRHGKVVCVKKKKHKKQSSKKRAGASKGTSR